MRNYYTYAYLRDDGTPYYIGKGKLNRIYSSLHRINLPKTEDRIIFLKQNLAEEEAFKHEIYMISVFGRKDLGTGILRNQTNGGEGNSGRVVSQETREKLRKRNTGWKHTKESLENLKKNHHGISKEQRKKMLEGLKNRNQSGKNNPNWNKKWWNNGSISIMSIKCPGEGYVLGRLYRRYNK